MSLIGFLLTICGILLTYGQTKKASSAALAAQSAANEVRSKVISFDSAYEVSKASAALRETQRHLRNDAWLSAVESYSTVREALVRLHELAPEIEVPEQEAIQLMLADIGAICRQIDRKGRDDKPPLNKARALGKARDYSEALERVSIQIQRAST